MQGEHHITITNSTLGVPAGVKYCSLRRGYLCKTLISAYGFELGYRVHAGVAIKIFVDSPLRREDNNMLVRLA